MIRLPDVDLPQDVKDALADYQKALNAIPDYDGQVVAAEGMFQKYRHNAVFAKVCEALTQMCCGAQGCNYCEVSGAEQVEHIKPKNLYPGDTFVWKNYAYACGPCNSRKRSQWAIFSATTHEMIKLRHKKGEPKVAPARGDPVFLNPRREDPLQFLELDLLGTFLFRPKARKGTRKHLRAEYTIKTLQLNTRDYLPKARRAAYNSYVALLEQYVSSRDQVFFKDALKDMGHRAVWEEMKRSARFIPKLDALFIQAPETLAW